MSRPRGRRREVSAGGVVVRRDADALRVLLIRDGHDHWGFPKGHLKAGEAPADAARREVAEETGVRALELGPCLDAIAWEFRARGRRVHKTCWFFLMHTEARRTAPQRAEGITQCAWATLDEAHALLSWDNAREVLGRARAALAADA